MSRDHVFTPDAIATRCAICGEAPGGRHHIAAPASAPALAVAKGVEARLEADATTAGRVLPSAAAPVGYAPAAYDFGTAIALLKQRGAFVRRRGWRARFLTLVHGDAYTAPPMAKREPWLGLVTAGGAIVPWTASHGDVLAEDWQEVTP